MIIRLPYQSFFSSNMQPIVVMTWKLSFSSLEEFLDKIEMCEPSMSL